MENASKNTTLFGLSKKQLAGYGYLIGDAALFVDGVLKARLYEKGSQKYKDEMNGAYAGLGWGLGGLAMAKYGSRPVPKQLEALEGKLADYLQQQGVELTPALLKQAQKEKDKNLWAKIEDFLYQYPTEVLNGVYAFFAMGLVKTGLNEIKDRNYANLGMGVLIMAGGLAGILFKDKLKLTGTLYAANNGFTVLGAYERYRDFNDPSKAVDAQIEAKKDSALYKNLWMLRGATAASYLFSNLTLRTVSTGSDASQNLTDEAQNELLRVSAEVIGNQSPQMQKSLITQAARYLADRRELNFNKQTVPELVARIEANLDSYRAAAEKNSSGESTAWAARSGDTAPQPEGVSR